MDDESPVANFISLNGQISPKIDSGSMHSVFCFVLITVV